MLRSERKIHQPNGHIIAEDAFDYNTWDKTATLWMRFFWGATQRSKRYRNIKVSTGRLIGIRLRGARFVGIQWMWK